MKSKVYGIRLPRGTQVRKGCEPLNGPSRILGSSVRVTWCAIRCSTLSIPGRITVLFWRILPLLFGKQWQHPLLCMLKLKWSPTGPWCYCYLFELSLYDGWTIHGGPAYWSDGPENKHHHTPPKPFSGRRVV